MPKPIQVGRKERMSFGKINEVGTMPNLIDVQTSSYNWFIKEGRRKFLTTFHRSGFTPGI